MSVKIEIEFASMGEANAVRAWAAIQRGQAAYIGDAKKLSAETLRGAGVFTTLDGNARKTFDSMRKGISGAGRDFSGLATALIGAGGVREALRMIQEATHKMLEEAKAASIEYERLFKRFGSQASLQGTPLRDRAQQILTIAEKRATPEDKTFDAATQLRSSGFSTEESAGGSLDSFLKTLNATNQGGKEPVEVPQLVEAMASYFSAQGLDKNTANMDRVGVAFQRLFAEGQVQFPDFMQFASESVGMRGKMSIEEQMAAFASLRDVMPGDEAATGLSRFVTRTATMKAEEGNVKVLEAMGLKPEDVDLIGERFDEVLARYKAGLAKLKPEDREAALRQLFDLKGKVAAENIINQGTGGNYQKYLGVQGQRDEYEKAAKLMETGPNAARQRQEIAAKRRAFEKDQGLDLIMAELRAIAKEQGTTPVAIDNGLARLKDAIGLMGDNEENVRRSANVIFGPEMYERAKLRVERLKAGKDPNVEDTVGNAALTSPAAILKALEVQLQRALQHEDPSPFAGDEPKPGDRGFDNLPSQQLKRRIEAFRKNHPELNPPDQKVGLDDSTHPTGSAVAPGRLITDPITQRSRGDVDFSTADTGDTIARQMYAAQRSRPASDRAARDEVISRALATAKNEDVPGVTRESLEQSADEFGDDLPGFQAHVAKLFRGEAKERQTFAKNFNAKKLQQWEQSRAAVKLPTFLETVSRMLFAPLRSAAAPSDRDPGPRPLEYRNPSVTALLKSANEIEDLADTVGSLRPLGQGGGRPDERAGVPTDVEGANAPHPNLLPKGEREPEHAARDPFARQHDEVIAWAEQQRLPLPNTLNEYDALQRKKDEQRPRDPFAKQPDKVVEFAERAGLPLPNTLDEYDSLQQEMVGATKPKTSPLSDRARAIMDRIKAGATPAPELSEKAKASMARVNVGTTGDVTLSPKARESLERMKSGQAGKPELSNRAKEIMAGLPSSVGGLRRSPLPLLADTPPTSAKSGYTKPRTAAEVSQLAKLLRLKKEKPTRVPSSSRASRPKSAKTLQAAADKARVKKVAKSKPKWMSDAQGSGIGGQGSDVKRSTVDTAVAPSPNVALNLNPVTDALKTLAGLQRELITAFNRGPEAQRDRPAKPQEVIVKVEPSRGRPLERPNTVFNYTS